MLHHKHADQFHARIISPIDDGIDAQYWGLVNVADCLKAGRYMTNSTKRSFYLQVSLMIAFLVQSTLFNYTFAGHASLHNMRLPYVLSAQGLGTIERS